MVPIGIDMIVKAKITGPKSEGEPGKGGRKIFNDTHPQNPPPQKRWRPKVVEEKQTATKTENKTTTLQLSVGMADSPAIKAGPSTPQKRWRPKVVEINQTTTKTENGIATSQLSTGMVDSPAIKTRPSADDTDRLTPKAESSALYQDTSNDVPTPMEEDDLQGEDLVDYGATPEHLKN
jgi:hypothetical protein